MRVHVQQPNYSDTQLLLSVDEYRPKCVIEMLLIRSFAHCRKRVVAPTLKWEYEYWSNCSVAHGGFSR